MNVKPLHDWAVIRPFEGETKTAGGLFIPDTAKEKPAEGVIEAIGPGALEEEKRGEKKKKPEERKFIPTTVKPGDRVYYEQYAGQTYTIGNEERILVREKNILGVLPPRPVSTGVSSGKPDAAGAQSLPARKTTSRKATPKKGAKKKPARKKKTKAGRKSSLKQSRKAATRGGKKTGNKTTAAKRVGKKSKKTLKKR